MVGAVSSIVITKLLSVLSVDARAVFAMHLPIECLKEASNSKLRISNAYRQPKEENGWRYTRDEGTY